MKVCRISLFRLVVSVLTLAALLAISLACASPVPTPTPVPLAPPTPPVAPTAQPTPTRVLPSPTPVAAAKITYGGVLRYAGPMDDVLHPLYAVSSGFYFMAHTIFNNLVRFGPNETILPDLAKSWQLSPDNKVITFQLQPGVKFHDGTPFDAQAVKWNFDFMLNKDNVSPRRGEISSLIQKVEVINDLTVAIHMPQPSRPLLAQLGDRPGMMVSPTAVQKLGADFGRKPVGTGAFVFKEWIPDQRVVVVRNENYWEQGQPYVDTIQQLINNTADTQLAMIRTGETDIVEAIRAQDIPKIKASPIAKLSEPFPGRTDQMLFNLKKEPWNNMALRQAISYSIDRAKVVNVVFEGQAIPAHTFIQSGWAHNPDLKPIAYDPVKARAKLAEAGYPNGVKIRMASRTSSEEVLQAEVYQAMMREVGIDMEIVYIPDPDFTSPTERGYIQRVGFGTGRTSPRVDPHVFLVRRIHSTSAAGKESGINNPEIDKLLDEAVGIFDPAKAKPLYDRIQTILAGDAILIFVNWRLEYTALNKRVQNFQWSPDRFHRLRFLWLEK